MCVAVSKTIKMDINLGINTGLTTNVYLNVQINWSLNLNNQNDGLQNVINIYPIVSEIETVNGTSHTNVN